MSAEENLAPGDAEATARSESLIMATRHDTLARRMKKAAPRPHFTAEGWPTVTPRIFARDAKRLVGFIRKVFGATGTYRPNRPTELRIGGSILMINDTSARGPWPAFLYVYVPNVDTTYRRAVAAGSVGRAATAGNG